MSTVESDIDAATVLREAREASKAWARDIITGGRNVTSIVTQILDDRLETLVFTVLGLTKDRWGDGSGWTIDHVNNRDSVLKSFLTKKAKEAVDEWFENHAFELPELTSRQKIAIRKEYLDRLEKSVLIGAREQADRKAQAALDAIIEEPVELLRRNDLVEQINKLEEKKRELAQEIRETGRRERTG